MSVLACALTFPSLLPVTSPPTSPEPLPLDAFLATDPAPLAPLAFESHTEAGAFSFSYTFIEVGAAQYDVDQVDDDVDIYYGRGSLGLFEFLYLFGEYQNQSTDFQNTDTDLITLGAGAHFGVLRNIDLYAEIGWLYSDVSSDLSNLDETDDGFQVAGGVRWMVLPWTDGGLELDGEIGTVDLDNRLGSDDNPFIWSIGARLHFLKIVSVGVSYEQVEDDDQVLGNVRVSF